LTARRINDYRVIFVKALLRLSVTGEERLTEGLKKEVRTRGPSLEKTAQTRRAIVSAALAEFQEKGFADATMEGVARRAGVAKGTPYRYFPTKEALFSGVVRQEITGAFADVEGAKRERGETVEAFLRRSVLKVIADIEPKGRTKIARLAVLEGARFPALVEIYRQEMMDPVLDQITALLIEARDAGEPISPHLITYPHLFIAPIWAGIVYNEFLDKARPLDIKALMEAQIDLAFRRK
jgi:TetR/AcrR family transcriptional regulator, regulator of autoinduction and epiphytic fitness